MKIYLAGSFNEDWRLHVINGVQASWPKVERVHEWLIPKQHKPGQDKSKRDPKIFAPRDLAMIKSSDILAG